MNNWRRALRYRVWGLPKTTDGRYESYWDRVAPGDFLFFYVTKTVKGIIGVGKLRSKFKGQKVLLWSDEMKAQQIKYPWRFNFDVRHLLAEEHWHAQRWTISARNLREKVNIRPAAAINRVPEEKRGKLRKEMRGTWGIELR